MESSDEFPIRMKDPELDTEDEKTINWIYELILWVPLVIYAIVLGILASVTTIDFVGSWQIWTFLSLVPALGFIGGLFLKKAELQRSMFYGSVFLIGFMALVTMGLLGGLEIIGGGNALDIVIGFAGGLFWGSAFGIVGCIFLILGTVSSFYLKKLIVN
ncbi:MAG: hypothetical protein ACTSRD_05825 [Promethearchaeota archaeon]